MIDSGEEDPSMEFDASSTEAWEELEFSVSTWLSMENSQQVPNSHPSKFSIWLSSFGTVERVALILGSTQEPLALPFTAGWRPSSGRSLGASLPQRSRAGYSHPNGNPGAWVEGNWALRNLLGAGRQPYHMPELPPQPCRICQARGEFGPWGVLWSQPPACPIASASLTCKACLASVESQHASTGQVSCQENWRRAHFGERQRRLSQMDAAGIGIDSTETGSLRSEMVWGCSAWSSQIQSFQDPRRGSAAERTSLGNKKSKKSSCGISKNKDNEKKMVTVKQELKKKRRKR